jgi:N-acetylneuraminate synthase
MTNRSIPFNVNKMDLISQPFVIAEVGVNHEGNIDIAKKLIDDAVEGGADAVKFQSYKAETLASKDSPAYWDTSKEPIQSQYELFKKYDSFWKNEFEILKKYCDQQGIEFISTPFDIESATFLNEMVPFFKIASSDLTNKPFVEFICDFKKPIILSCGASYVWEIQRSVEWISRKGNKLALLHCVLNYPTLDEHANLGMISLLKTLFPRLVIGYSDHTLPKNMKTLETATLLGAVILEKHFTYDKSLPGNDHYHAMDKDDLILFRESIDHLIKLIGVDGKPQIDNQKAARENARRSLIIKKAIKSGEVISPDHLTWKRPASGICPSQIDQVLGRKATVDLDEDTLLNWAYLGEIQE